MQDWDILVTFQQKNLLEEKNDRSPFFQDLLDDYGKSKLDELDLREIDIDNMLREFGRRYEKEAGKDFFAYGKEEIDAAQFCLDVTLFQVFRCNYHITSSFKALAKSILGSMISGSLELPEKYRHFVSKRAEDKRKKEVNQEIQNELAKKKQAKKVEMERLDKSFDKMYSDMISKNKSFRKTLEAKAIDSLKEEGIEEGDMIFQLSLEHKMRDLAKADFLNGDIMNYNIKGNSRESLTQ